MEYQIVLSITDFKQLLEPFYLFYITRPKKELKNKEIKFITTQINSEKWALTIQVDLLQNTFEDVPNVVSKEICDEDLILNTYLSEFLKVYSYLRICPEQPISICSDTNNYFKIVLECANFSFFYLE